ncbi:MAG: hypothetical protein IPJ71_12505 [Bdellovibrionales bacterium]|nr:hypothetical protein [Bdellovibrionales bacterium]
MNQNKTSFRKSAINRKIKEKVVKKDNLTFSIPSDLHERFSKSVKASGKGLTMNKVVEQLIRTYLGED